MKKNLYNFIGNGGITVIIAIFVIAVFICSYGIGDAELIDWTIFTAIIIVMLLENISNWVTKILLNKLEDGNKLVWIPRDELKDIVILDNRLIYQGKEYPMMPSSLATMAMYIEYLGINGILDRRLRG